MAFTPAQLQGLESYSLKWNNDGTYSIKLQRRVTTKFLGCLWPVSKVVTDTISYPGVLMKGSSSRYQSSNHMDADVKFLEEYIANMWQK